jgi:hypothetical protein
MHLWDYKKNLSITFGGNLFVEDLPHEQNQLMSYNFFVQFKLEGILFVTMFYEHNN